MRFEAAGPWIRASSVVAVLVVGLGAALAFDGLAPVGASSPESGALVAAPTATAGPPPLSTRPVSFLHHGQLIHSRVYAEETAPDGRRMVAGSLMVRFRAGVTATRRARAHQTAAADAVRPHFDDWEVVHVPPGTTARALAAYRADPDVAYVKPNYLLVVAGLSNDSRLGEQWGLGNIGAPAAWDITDGTNSRVAIVDVGIDDTHPDLMDKVINGNVWGPEAPDPRDYTVNGHGTAVAGVTAARANNAEGAAGVAPGAGLINAKAGYRGPDGRGNLAEADVQAAIRWAAANRAQVINLSFAAQRACTPDWADATSYAFAAGAVLVASAGNDASAASDMPANCPSVVSVGGHSRDDTPWSGTNYGPSVYVTAPADSLLAPGPGIDYQTATGTSVAAPHVSGVSSLIWATLCCASPQAVIDRLLASADQNGGAYSQHGHVNAAVAVGKGRPPRNDYRVFAQPAFLGSADAVSTLNATEEPGESLSCNGVSVGKTVWYAYGATSAQRTVVDTAGSGFDTIAAVYQQNASGGLELVTCNDNGPSGPQALAAFGPQLDQTYYLQIGGAAGASGSLVTRLYPQDEVPPSPTPTSTTSPTATPTLTPTPTATSTATPTPTATGTATATASATVTPTATSTATTTPTPTGTATGTATATPTLTASATATPPPGPQVGVAVLVDPTTRTLRATLAARDAGCTPNNRIRALRFTRLTNATVEVPGLPLVAAPSSGALLLAAPVPSLTLTVHRLESGQAATVELVVTDACGDWPTFVGGGPSAF